jgi:hypothetical protein
MYRALAVQAGGREVWPLLFRTIGRNFSAEKAVALLKRVPGFGRRSKSGQYKQGHSNKRANRNRREDLIIWPQFNGATGIRAYRSGYTLTFCSSWRRSPLCRAVRHRDGLPP